MMCKIKRGSKIDMSSWNFGVELPKNMNDIVAKAVAEAISNTWKEHEPFLSPTYFYGNTKGDPLKLELSLPLTDDTKEFTVMLPLRQFFSELIDDLDGTYSGDDGDHDLLFRMAAALHKQAKLFETAAAKLKAKKP